MNQNENISPLLKRAMESFESNDGFTVVKEFECALDTYKIAMDECDSRKNISMSMFLSDTITDKVIQVKETLSDFYFKVASSFRISREFHKQLLCLVKAFELLADIYGKDSDKYAKELSLHSVDIDSSNGMEISVFESLADTKSTNKNYGGFYANLGYLYYSMYGENYKSGWVFDHALMCLSKACDMDEKRKNSNLCILGDLYKIRYIDTNDNSCRTKALDYYRQSGNLSRGVDLMK